MQEQNVHPNSVREIDTAPYKLSVYPIENEYIGEIKMPSMKNNQAELKITTIVILDRSTSMSNHFERFVQEIMPLVFQKLNYESENKIHLITFDSFSERFDTTVELFKTLSISARNATDMQPAIKELHELLMELSTEQLGIRLLTISDGIIYDPIETKQSADELISKFGGTFEINSQAVRLFTSTLQPDTVALSSLLQLNNVKKVDLLDISSEKTDEEIASAIAALFVDDHLTEMSSIEAPDKIFKTVPWQKEYSNKVTTFPGDNVVWMKSLSSAQIKSGEKVKINIKPALDLKTYNKILDKKKDQFMTKIKILKVVNTDSAEEEIKDMVGYFKKHEEYLLKQEEEEAEVTEQLGIRLRKQNKSVNINVAPTFAERMTEISNNEEISKMDAAQAADFIRAKEQTDIPDISPNITDDDADNIESFSGKCNNCGYVKSKPSVLVLSVAFNIFLMIALFVAILSIFNLSTA